MFEDKFFKRKLASTPLGKALEAGPLMFEVSLVPMSTPVGEALAGGRMQPLEGLQATMRALAWDVCTLKGIDRTFSEVRTQ
jgi:hypothetical protein